MRQVGGSCPPGARRCRSTIAWPRPIAAPPGRRRADCKVRETIARTAATLRPGPPPRATAIASPLIDSSVRSGRSQRFLPTIVACRTVAVTPGDSVTRPSRIHSTRSARAATSWLCVMTTSVSPFLRCNVSNKSSTAAPDCESRLPVGSSANNSGGSLASARAIATRCRCPTESWAGRWQARSLNPTRANRSEARWPRCSARAGPFEHRHLHVLPSRQRRQQVKRLEHETDPVAHAPRPAAGKSTAAGRRDKPRPTSARRARQQVEQGALAAAAGTHDRQILARPHRQRNVAQGRHVAVGIKSADVLDAQQRRAIGTRRRFIHSATPGRPTARAARHAG